MMNRRNLITAISVAIGSTMLSALPVSHRQKKLYSKWDYDTLMQYMAMQYAKKVRGYVYTLVAPFKRNIIFKKLIRRRGDTFTRIYFYYFDGQSKEVVFTLHDTDFNKTAGQLIADGAIKEIYWA